VLENEFGTKNSEDVVRKILEEGDVQDSKVCHVVASGKKY
jgi:ribosome maturation protein Sdo1